MAKKKVVVLGVSPDRQTVYEAELRDCHVVFASSPEEAFSNARTADVVAASLDVSGTFFERLFERGYEGHVVPFTNSSIRMRRAVEIPGRKNIYPTSCRDAPSEILKVLNRPTTETKEELLAD